MSYARAQAEYDRQGPPEPDGYHDANGEPIDKGDRVRIAGPHKIPSPESSGVILSISDPDGDVDDEGRSVYYPPRVTVLFDIGDEDYFLGYHVYGDDGFTFEDLVKL
jgi:hypothetical protein